MISKKFLKGISVILAIMLALTTLMFANRTSAEEETAEAATSSEEEAAADTEEATAEEGKSSHEEEKTVVDLTDATTFTFSDEGITASEGAYTGYEIDGTALTIKEAGVYVLSGSAENGTVVVKKNVTGVTLVLNGLDLSASATAPLACNKGSEVTIFVAEDTENTLSDDEYNNDEVYTDEDQYPDIENAVIKCKDGSQVTICGTGTLTINANGKNGIKGGADLYEEDEDGNETETLLSEASLTIKEVTLEITAGVNDALKSDKDLNILSGNITISAADDGIKADYVLNIGEEDTEGPVIEIKEAKEGIEAAELNVYSGNVTVNATDDGINAANSDLKNYSFSFNQYGGYVYVNVTRGDGIDSNGTIVLEGGTLEVYSPSMGDGDPLDSERGTSLNGTTVLAVGHLGMPQSYSAETPYVVFGSSTGGQGGFSQMPGFDQMPDFDGNDDAGQGGPGGGGNPGGPGGFDGTGFSGDASLNGREDFSGDEGPNGRGGFGWNGGTAETNLVTAGSTITIVDENGEVLYTAEAVRDASYVLFSDPALNDGDTYTLMADGEAVAEAEAGTASTSGMGGFNQMPGNGEWPDLFGDDDWSEFFGGDGWSDIFGGDGWSEFFGSDDWSEFFGDDWSEFFENFEWPGNGGNSGRPGQGQTPGNGGNQPGAPGDDGNTPGGRDDGGWS
ncbi:MAG: carbohydrate-binding domain-containing protein [Lachnospiraceae bacterium]|nr:carbohydrate-binding domain-containing protein [Lachnospiraceae bacterium]